MEQLTRTTYLAAIYRINKEAKIYRDLRKNLKDLLFHHEQPTRQLVDHLSTLGISPISTLHADLDETVVEIKALDERQLLIDLEVAASEIAFYTEEDSESLFQEFYNQYKSDLETYSALHDELHDLRIKQTALYTLKDKAIKQMDIPLIGLHNGVDEIKYEYYEEQGYGFHVPIDTNEEVDEALILRDKPIEEISSRIDAEKSLDLRLDQAIAILQQLINE